LAGYSVSNFNPVEALIKQGYDATIAEMPQIKEKIKRRISDETIIAKRNDFNNKKPNLVFSGVTVSGVNSQQKKYVERLFKRDQKTFDLTDIRRGYYKLVADETFETIYPKISYNPVSDSYNFEIVAKPQKSFTVDFGGNISTRPISNVFLGIQYNYLNKKSYTFGTNVYSGRFYESVQLSGRVDYPSRIPLFLAADLTYNHFDYYNTSSIFIENPRPTYIEQADRRIGLRMGTPLNRNTRISIGTSFINNNDKYSPINEYAIGDQLDKTILNASRSTLSFEQYTFNRKQYPSKGRNFLLSANFYAGRESFESGGIGSTESSVVVLPMNKIVVNSKYRQWFNIKVSDENYFFQKRGYALGYLAEGVFSNQPLFSSYYSTLLAAPAFYPMQDSRSLFLQNFRATSYLAGGLKNVIALRRHLDLRAEGYVFLPYEKFEKVGFQGVTHAEPFSKWRYAATAGLVYHTPVGPISFSYNIYDDPIKRNGVLLHLGYLIYNKRSIE
ncbi:MAG: patatin, partial [Pedobacter sp.]